MHSVKYFQSTLYDLKNNNINVVFYAGQKSAGTITTALHQGGATRISGAFQVHTDPQLMEYLAARDVPIELAPTEKMIANTSDVQISIGGSFFRLLMDNGMNVCVCSFRGQLAPLTRTETWMQVYNSVCQVPGTEHDIGYIFRTLGNAFRSNFLSFSQRQRMYKEFVEEASRLLHDAGYKYFRSKIYYIPKTINSVSK